MKTAEELNALKEEVEALNAKLVALSEDELRAVAGGSFPCSNCPHSPHCDTTPEECGRYR